MLTTEEANQFIYAFNRIGAALESIAAELKTQNENNKENN